MKKVRVEAMATAMMDFKMYRAVPRAGHDPRQQHTCLTTQRMPGNIPYFVDNIWEWLRPAGAPSRRHAVYASPTVELALDNASAGRLPRHDYVACEILLCADAVKIAHLGVSDARQHQDIHRLLTIATTLAAGFADGPVADKARFAPLFLPGVRQDEITAFFQSGKAPEGLEQRLRAACAFWDTATLQVNPQCNGEMFFWIPPDAHYLLLPVSRT